MKFSYNLLQSFFKEKLPSANELAEALMMHFFEVEEIEKLEKDTILDIDILSSRAGDCFSHNGVAREIAAITGKKYQPFDTKIRESKQEITERIEADVRSACSRYTLRAVDNVKVKESPLYIQQRLKTCGIKPINNIVDITNYVMLETGQPLHAFDADKIEGGKIFVRYAKKREKIVTLDEKRYELKDNILIIADELSPIGIAGIKGGIVPEIDANTKSIYLEAGNFDPITIRKGSQDLKLRTDASLRFEHGISPELTQIAVDRAAKLISEIAKGNVVKGMIDYYPEKAKETEISFKIDELRKVLGVDISLKEVEKILRSLEFKVKRSNGSFFVIPPVLRTDIFIKEDVFEEVGRIYGYENIEKSVPEESVIPAEKEEYFEVKDFCKNLWQSFGFNESYNYSFINEDGANCYDIKKLIEMEKPVSLEFKYLRPSLLLGLLKNVAENEKNYQDIRIFELGSVFFKEGIESTELKKLSAVSTVDDFYQMKGKIDMFLRKLSGKSASYKETEKNSVLNTRRAAEVLLNNEEIGFLGEASQEMKKKLKIKREVVLFEIDFEKIVGAYESVKKYEQILKFPSSVRDISVLVPKNEPYLNVLEKISKEGGAMLRKVDLFDFYEGKEIPKNMKNFAFRLIFQAKDKTLSSKEVNVLQEKIIKALDKVPEWKVRK